jgi:hypothetical protein
MKSKLLCCLLMTVLLITGSAQAQQPEKIPRIGYLTGSVLSSNTLRTEAFRKVT